MAIAHRARGPGAGPRGARVARAAAALLAAALLAGCVRQAAAPGPAEELCGVANFAWTIEGALARSAQPSGRAWGCLKKQGFTTIVQQNGEADLAAERDAVSEAGMAHIASYAIPDQTAYDPATLEAMLHDIIGRLRAGERVLVHDAGGRGRIGLWEVTVLIWDGRPVLEAIDRSIALGWKIDCDRGGNGQIQAANAIAAALGQPGHYPPRDRFGTAWQDCPRPAYMAGWDYSAIVWPEGGGALWSAGGAR